MSTFLKSLNLCWWVHLHPRIICVQAPISSPIIWHNDLSACLGLAGNSARIAVKPVYVRKAECCRQAGWGEAKFTCIRPLCVLHVWCVCLRACCMHFPEYFSGNCGLEPVKFLPGKVRKAHDKGIDIGTVAAGKPWWMGGQWRVGECLYCAYVNKGKYRTVTASNSATWPAEICSYVGHLNYTGGYMFDVPT